jgi:gas vesicle protein
MYNLNKVNESKINEMSSIYEDMNNKLTEMGKENENYQKFTLEKIKTIQKDSMETRLQQQNELIKMEDSKENRINAQFSQIKNLLTLSDKNIKEETEFRKNMINDLRNEILNIFAQKDDQICKLEKTQLETEKNLISLNKDYITSFNELINKHNEKYNYELKSIRSLIEAGLTKVDIKMEKDLKVYEENLTILKSNILEQKTNIANLDTFIKDSINEIENKMEVSKGANSDYFNKFDLLSSSFNQFMKECLNTIEKNKTETENKLMEIIEKKIGEVNLKIKNNSEANDKHFNDLESKITDMQNLINNINLRKVDYQLNDNNNEQKNSNTFLVSELVQKICDDNIIPLKEFINNLQKELINSMNNKIEESKKNFSLTESKNIENIKKMVSDEAGAVESKIMEKVGEDHTLLLGEVEKVVVNAEHRIKQKYDTEIKKLEEDLESLTIKVGLGP